MRVAASRTPVTPSAVYSALAAAWEVQFVVTPSRAPLLVLTSQWSLETGAGAACMNFNLGNMKSSGVSGDWCYFTTTELEHGKVVTYHPDSPTSRFRAFASLAGGASDYLFELSHRFRRAWDSVGRGDPGAFAHALKMQGYYTAKENVYAASLSRLFGIYETVLGLEVDLFSVAGVQTALARVGFDPGTIDGQFGPGTKAAVRHFQAHFGLFVDGLVGGLTREALGRAWLGTGRVDVVSPPPVAL